VHIQDNDLNTTSYGEHMVNIHDLNSKVML